MVIKLPRSRESTPVAVTPPSTTLEWMVVRFVRVSRVSRVSRVCPGSPRCRFTGSPGVVLPVCGAGFFLFVKCPGLTRGMATLIRVCERGMRHMSASI